MYRRKGKGEPRVLSSTDETRLQLPHRNLIVLGRREQVAVGVEGHLNRRMSHQRLDALRRETLLDKQ